MLKRQDTKNLFLFLALSFIFLFILSDSAWADYRPGTPIGVALFPLLFLMLIGGKIGLLIQLLAAILIGLIVHRRIIIKLFIILAVLGSVILLIARILSFWVNSLEELLFFLLALAMYLSVFATIAFLSSTIASKFSKIKNFQESFYKTKLEKNDWRYLIVPGIITLLTLLELWTERASLSF